MYFGLLCSSKNKGDRSFATEVRMHNVMSPDYFAGTLWLFSVPCPTLLLLHTLSPIESFLRLPKKTKKHSVLFL